MSQWVIKGIRTGIKTTAYPGAPESAAGVTPGLPQGGEMDVPSAGELIECCPTRVFGKSESGITADVRRCVHCYRCERSVGHPAAWANTYEWASIPPKGAEGLANKGITGVPGPSLRNADTPSLRHSDTFQVRSDAGFGRPFRGSIHILVVDAGDCGACLNEVKQLNSPYYNMHRLGFFITPSPRHADVLLVVGPVTDHIRPALLKAYEAMPTPKRVVAAGACALTGGVFAGSFACSKGVGEVLPVDVEVPGNPPPPLAILHGLLVAAGRKTEKPG